MLRENQVRRGKNIVKWIWSTFDEAHMNRTRFHSLCFCFVRLVANKGVLARAEIEKVLRVSQLDKAHINHQDSTPSPL